MKTSYPTTADLARFLAGSGLFPMRKVTATGATTTATLNTTAQIRVGDTLYFSGTGEVRTVTTIPTSTTVTYVTNLTTTPGEAVYHFIQPFDLATKALAGYQMFEDAAGRKLLATADTTRVFDPPTHLSGMLDLKADLAAITTVTLGGAVKTLYTDYRPLPEDGPAEGKPYNRFQFRVPYLYPQNWGQTRIVSITGRWGMFDAAAGMPEDAWLGMLATSAVLLIPQLGAYLTRGITSWHEADVTESYGNTPLGGLAELWKAQADEAARRYRRVTVG